MGPAAVQTWIGEKQYYHYDLDDGYAGYGNRPPGCTAPEKMYCGHFTQVIWKATQLVGCGKAQGTPQKGGSTYIVCNYYPSGNYAGQKPY
jgi:pathogenesis-related protein 1